MIERLKPYPAMKNSGVPWLGEVPAHWDVRKLGNWLGLNQITLPEDTTPDYTFAYLDIGSVGTGRLNAKPEKMRFGDSPSRARRVVRPGDTIVSTVRTYLKSVWHAEHANAALIASTGFAVLTPKSGTFPKFASYLCQCEPFTNRVTAESVGIAYPAIAESRLRALHLCVPPLCEQTAIVRFLDHADRRIRCYIRAKQKLIALLEEQKQAIIHQAVTGQIDVRTGQPYPAYKPSGVSWLGDVPAHWEVRKLGQIARVFNGATPNRVQSAYWKNGTVPWLNSSKVNERVVVKPSELVTQQAVQECSISLVPSGSVILGLVGQGRTRGMSALLGIETTISQNLAAIVPTTVANGKFLHHLLTALYRYIRELGRGGNQEALNCDLVSRLRLPFPPLADQIEMVRCLAGAISRLTASIEKVSQEAELLREYRTRLISDVVCGKVDVSDAVAGLPKVDPLASEDEQCGTVNPDVELEFVEVHNSLEDANA